MIQVRRFPAASVASLGGLALSLVFIFSAVRSTAEPNPKPDSEATKKRCLGSWREVLVMRAGKKFEESTDFMCYRLQPKESNCWEFAGELMVRPLGDELHLDVTCDPMRLDLMTRGQKGERRFSLGIIKFEGDSLIWVTSSNDERPKEFSSTQANGYLLRVLKPCEYLDQVSTVKKKKP